MASIFLPALRMEQWGGTATTGRDMTSATRVCIGSLWSATTRLSRSFSVMMPATSCPCMATRHEMLEVDMRRAASTVVASLRTEATCLRHDVGDVAQRVERNQPAGDVRLGHDADELSVLDDGQPPDALDVHHAVGLEDGDIGRDRVDGAGHSLGHLEPMELGIAPGHAVEHVLLREDADDSSSICDDHARDAQLRHLLGDREDRVVQGGRDHVLAHDVGHAEYVAVRTPRAVGGTGEPLPASGSCISIFSAMDRLHYPIPSLSDLRAVRTPALPPRRQLSPLSVKRRADLGTKPPPVGGFLDEIRTCR